MPVQTRTFALDTRGFADVVDLTPRLEPFLREVGASDGLLTVFVPGATAAVTAIEYEEGAVADFQASIRRLLPEDIPYRHDARWGDGNGFAHVRAAWLGPSLAIPVEKGRPLRGPGSRWSWWISTTGPAAGPSSFNSWGDQRRVNR
jgi:secondary thiamine-phosphate synthase enzyme